MTSLMDISRRLIQPSTRLLQSSHIAGRKNKVVSSWLIPRKGSDNCLFQQDKRIFSSSSLRHNTDYQHHVQKDFDHHNPFDHIFQKKHQQHRQVHHKQLQACRGFSAGASTTNTSSTSIVYCDDEIRRILSEVKTIAMVGASPKWIRPSNFAMKYLQEKGYRVIPVNPSAAGQTILGETCYASLSDIPPEDQVTIDMVDMFLSPKYADSILTDVLNMIDDSGNSNLKVFWMQLGVINHDAAKRAEEAGLTAIMNRCPKIEFSRLFGELGWHGFNSHVISSKRRMTGSCTRQGGLQDARFDTRAIHAGCSPDPTTGARSTPIYQTTSYVFEDINQAASLFNLQTYGNIYSRLSNPTTSVLEEKIASLEGGRGATCTSSGHAAQLLTLFTLLEPGDCIVASDKLYGGTITQFGKTIKKFGWSCHFVDIDDIEKVHDVVHSQNKDKKVKLLWAESIANPGGYISDISALAEIARSAKIPLAIDNTLASPALCRPIEYGADLVIHSTTKFMSGHGNAMGGAVVDSGTFDWMANDGKEKYPSLCQPEPAYHNLVFAETFGDLAFTTYGHSVGLRDLGPTMAPMNAYLTITGMETLSLRMEKHVQNAFQVAQFLDQHPKVAWVSYAGLPTSKYYPLAQKYIKGDKPGSVFTFGLKFGGYDAGVQFVENCVLLSHLANVGDTRSLVLHPASTTHRQLTDEQREACGAGNDVVRLSIGLEDIQDIIWDIKQALDKIRI